MCPECKGTGKVQLLFTTVDCEACNVSSQTRQEMSYEEVLALKELTVSDGAYGPFPIQMDEATLRQWQERYGDCVKVVGEVPKNAKEEPADGR